MARFLCLAVGYLCGCFLTGELIARMKTGKSARDLGTGNPGMVNISSSLGRKWGAVVLLGDVAKTALACILCRLFFCPELGRFAVLYAGLGAVLGHNFPFWKGFRGGKGVAVTCAFLVFSAPMWGLIACTLGLFIVLLTGWLPLGAVMIPTLFVPAAFAVYGPETGALAVVATAIMFSRHYRGLGRIIRGVEPRKFRPKKA